MTFTTIAVNHRHPSHNDFASEDIWLQEQMAIGFLHITVEKVHSTAIESCCNSQIGRYGGFAGPALAAGNRYSHVLTSGESWVNRTLDTWYLNTECPAREVFPYYMMGKRNDLSGQDRTRPRTPSP